MSDPLARALRAPAPQAAAAATRFADRAAAEHRADLAYATTASPLGELLLLSGPRGLVMMHYLDEPLEPALEQIARRRSPRIVRSAAALDPWRRELDEYFAGKRSEFGVPIHEPGTPFQERVWAALREIPYGETLSYGELARTLGDPAAVRAVAQANGRNRIAVLVPCHRVIGADGGLGGYGGGLWRKRRLLEIEGAALS